MTDTKNIILLLDMSRESGRGVLCGIGKYAELHGSWIFHFPTPFYRTSLIGNKKSTFQLRKFSADGLITRHFKDIGEYLHEDLQIITFGEEKKYPGVPNIITDFNAIGKLAANHFIERGFKQFAFCGYYGLKWSIERCDAFSASLKKSGFDCHFYNEKKSRKEIWEIEIKSVVKWLGELKKPVGILACNDERARQVVDACKEANISIPEEIAVLGIDNDALICNLTTPPLSSISLAWESGGYEAAQLLDRMMWEEKSSNEDIIISATHIAVRGSTDILAINDSLVAEALTYIRRNIRKPLVVSDILDELTVSRSNLESRFQYHLGRSIFEEIRRSRIERIVRLLLETNMTISEIATDMGLENSNNLSRYFKKIKGMSLIEYRKKFHHPINGTSSIPQNIENDVELM